jgi:hypothetical protein
MKRCFDGDFDKQYLMKRCCNGDFDNTSDFSLKYPADM